MSEPAPLRARSCVGLVLVALGCSHAGELVAEDGRRRLVARDANGEVTVVLTTGAWKGDPVELPDEVTVIHVLVANLGDTPIRLAPGDLQLRDTRGFRYELLDAGASFVRVEGPEAAAYDRAFERSYDPGRSLQFVPFDAPQTAIDSALPWGLLEPGTQMRGFIYFETVVRTANQAKLTWHLASADDRPVLDAEFDLFVARP